MNSITCHGTDGGTMTYYAVTGEHVPPEYHGWACVVEDADGERMDPHKLSAAEVVGDLLSMEIDREEILGQVRLFTEGIIEALDDQGRAAQARGDDHLPYFQRSIELRAELQAAEREPKPTTDSAA